MSLPLIMAGAQILGGAVNAISTHRANKRNVENWEKQSLMNSAASQSSRMRAAGLAPYSAVSQIAANNKVDRAPDKQVSNFGDMIGSAGSSVGTAEQIGSQTLRNVFMNLLDESSTKLNKQNFNFLVDTHDARVLQENETYREIKYRADNLMEEYLQGKMFKTARNFQDYRNAVYTNDLLAIQKNLESMFGVKRSLLELATMYSDIEANRANVGYTNARARNVDLLNQYQSGYNNHIAKMWSYERWQAIKQKWLDININIPASERQDILDQAYSTYQTVYWESFDPTSPYYVGVNANDVANFHGYGFRVDHQSQVERSHNMKLHSFINTVVPFAQVGAYMAPLLQTTPNPVRGMRRTNVNRYGEITGGYTIDYSF